MTNNVELGAHLVSPRMGYSHHGIYAGNGIVIHYSGLAEGFSKGGIWSTTLEDFALGKGFTIRQHFKPTYDTEESVQRAQARVGEDQYNVIFNNCEHFVTWCILGVASSSQIEAVKDFIIDAAMAARIFAQEEAKRQVINGTIINNIGVLATQEAQRRLSQEAMGVISSSAINSIVAKTATTEAVKLAASSSIGVAAGIATSTGLATSAGGVVGTALLTGAAATGFVPLAAAVAVTAGVGFVGKKIIDWVWD